MSIKTSENVVAIEVKSLGTSLYMGTDADQALEAYNKAHYATIFTIDSAGRRVGVATKHSKPDAFFKLGERLPKAQAEAMDNLKKSLRLVK